jgi:ATP-dependent DNA helicase RecQ
MDNEKTTTLKKYFGYNSFKDGQEEIIDNILAKRDVLCIMPTGAGKSICYQIPALIFDGISIVVSPLISLMKDQVQFLVNAGVKAAYVNSSLSPQVIEKVIVRIKNSCYKIIYVAPERLNTYAFWDAVKDLNISQVVIDEAHCISKWGHDFRPSYLGITQFIQNLPNRPAISAFTATATKVVREDICAALKFSNPYIKISSFDRPNLFFDVRRPDVKGDELFSILNDKREESGIIYCSTRKTVEDVCYALCEKGYSATMYHAGLDSEVRTKNQDDFIYDRKRIMVATNAFGMGIDKGNVAYVIHFNMPKDMESYYQEAGRAGRDGNKAQCILLFGEGDINKNKYILSHSTVENQNIDNAYKLLYRMADYCKTDGCLRQYILGYFGEKYGGDCCNCSNCADKNYELVDVTDYAEIILRCIKSLNKNYGVAIITSILRGGKEKMIVEGELFKNPEYAALKNISKQDIVNIIDKMLSMKIISRKGIVYPVITICPEYLKGEQKLSVTIKRKKNGKLPQITAPENKSKNELFIRLKNVRSEFAKNERVPAYIVFSDATLLDMSNKKPTTKEEFLSVSGVGEIKCNRYSGAFIEEIKKYKQDIGDI